jgi:Sulfotransferase family
MKGGTTSLYRYLRQHPDVFMPNRKELNFFLDSYDGPAIDPPEERNWRRGIAWYARQFGEVEHERAVGEASPNYSRYPTYPGVPERMAMVVPGATLIYLVRNPIDRVRSHYLHDVANGREQQPFDVAVRRDERYLAPSQYARQVDEYLRFFSFERILLLDADDLRNRRADTVRRVLDFIGVDIDAPLRLEGESNRSNNKLARSRLVTSVRRSRYRRIVPKVVRSRLRQLTAQPLDTSKFSIDVETRDFLRKAFTSDVRRLAELTGEDFDRRWRIEG